MEVIDYSLLLGIYNLKNGAREGVKLLTLHDQNGKFTLAEKVAQVNHADYGDMLIPDNERHDFNFYESIQGGIVSKDRTKVYFMGIIDTLTYYGTKKQIEYNLKHIIHGSKMSCMPPRQYADRFYNYILNTFE